MSTETTREPSNYERAQRAIQVTQLHASLIGQKFNPEHPTAHDGAPTCVKDLLSDLMHACDRMSLDFDDLVESAHRNYQAECVEETGVLSR